MRIILLQLGSSPLLILGLHKFFPTYQLVLLRGHPEPHFLKTLISRALGTVDACMCHAKKKRETSCNRMMCTSTR
jgi:hypothetical protein